MHVKIVQAEAQGGGMTWRWGEGGGMTWRWGEGGGMTWRWGEGGGMTWRWGEGGGDLTGLLGERWGYPSPPPPPLYQSIIGHAIGVRGKQET